MVSPTAQARLQRHIRHVAPVPPAAGAATAATTATTATAAAASSFVDSVSVQALSWTYVDGSGGGAAAPAGVIEETLQWAAAHPDVAKIDVEDRLFARTDTAYLRGLRAEARRLGVGWGYLGITVNFLSPLSQQSMDAEVSLGKKWIDVAAALGVSMLRVPGNGVGTVDADWAWHLIRSKFHTLVAYGQNVGVSIGLHNHAGAGDAIPATGHTLCRMLDEVPGLHLILDLGNGNFTGCPELHIPGERAPEALYQNVQAATARATAVRAKFVDNASGTEGFVDFRHLVSILR